MPMTPKKCCCVGGACYTGSPSCAFVASSPGTPTLLRPRWTVPTPWDSRRDWPEKTPGTGIRYLDLANGHSIEAGDGHQIWLIPEMYVTPLGNSAPAPCKWTYTHGMIAGGYSEYSGAGATGAIVRNYRSLNFEFERTSASTAVVRCYLWDTGHAVKLWLFHNELTELSNDPKLVIGVDDHPGAVAGQLDPIDGVNYRLAGPQGRVTFTPCENLAPGDQCSVPALSRPTVTWADAMAIAQEADPAAAVTPGFGGCTTLYMDSQGCPGSPSYVACASIGVTYNGTFANFTPFASYEPNHFPRGWGLQLDGSHPGLARGDLWYGRSTAPNRWPDGLFYRVSNVGSFATTTVDDGLP